MYTQCPECSSAFRVTAQILKQAAGKVRCGGCGLAFDALDSLSEDKPRSRFREEPEPPRSLPELRPEQSDAGDDDQTPASIAAEQSAALLKTLDELAGEDILLEDTGVEWRVLNDFDDGECADDPDPESAASTFADTGSLKFFIEDDNDEVPTIIEESTDARSRPESEADYAEPEFAGALEPAPGPDAGGPGSRDLEEADAPRHRLATDDMRFDDDTPLPDEFGFADESSAFIESRSSGFDRPSPQAEENDAQVDLALTEPDEWEDLLGEVGQAVDAHDQLTVAAAAAPVDRPGPTTVDLDDDDARLVGTQNLPSDADTQLAQQAEALVISQRGTRRVVVGDAAAGEAALAAGGRAPAQEELDTDDFERSTGVDVRDVPASIGEADDDADGPGARADETEDREDHALAGRVAVDAIDDGSSIDDDLIAAAFQAESALQGRPPVADARRTGEFYVPPQTEEEETLNRMVDQDLMLAAAGGVAVSPRPGDQWAYAAEHPMLETIVMEGDLVSNDFESEAGAVATSPATTFMEQAARTISGGLDAVRRKTEPTRHGIIAGVMMLALLLGLQFVHQSRDALATVPVFNRAVGPVYRMLGRPLTPSWDVSGWRFEVSKGSTDAYDGVLTIYSRIGNDSQQALPYPLVHVSLTDRFEEIIGSRVLDPSEYLPGGVDPREPVGAGNSFIAVIAIESPAPEATGFKLGVCYRLGGDRLRCAIEGFR